MIYFVQPEHGGPIKIGHAGNPGVRLAELQIGAPHPLTIRRTETGGLDRERELHLRFAAYRLRGEWFAAAEELADYCDGVVTESSGDPDPAQLRRAYEEGYRRGYWQGHEEGGEHRARRIFDAVEFWQPRGPDDFVEVELSAMAERTRIVGAAGG